MKLLEFLKKSFLCSTIITSAAFVSCGKPSESPSQLTYKVAPKAYAGLLRKVHNANIKICMSNDARTEAHKPDVTHAIEEWTSALVDFANDPVTQEVVYVPANDPSCDAIVLVGNYNPARTSMGNKPKVYIANSGWFGSRTVTLHEFGHAFGLYDTYSGRGGSCQSGQPNSVMCKASYENLTTDDINGIRVAYTNARAKNFAADDDRIPVIVE